MAKPKAKTKTPADSLAEVESPPKEVAELDRIEETIETRLDDGFRLYKWLDERRGKNYGRLHKHGEKDITFPWRPEYDAYLEMSKKAASKPGAARSPTPETSAKTGALSALAAVTAKEAEYLMRRRLVSGMAMERLARAAEARGFASVEDYVAWLHRRSVARPPGVATAWSSFKDFAQSVLIADALGVEVDPDMIPAAYVITKMESKTGKGRW